MSIYGFIAKVTSELHYVNEADESIETEFVFPLDSDAAVYKFEAEIDGKTIVAEVQEKSQVLKFTLRKVLVLNHEQGYQYNCLLIIVITKNVVCIIKKKKEIDKSSFSNNTKHPFKT